MKKERILEIMEKTNLFPLKEQKGHMLNFSKRNGKGPWSPVKLFPKSLEIRRSSHKILEVLLGFEIP